MNSLYPWEERVVTVVLIYILNQLPNESEINECDSIETQEIKKLKWFDWNPKQKLLKKILPSLSDSFHASPCLSTDSPNSNQL